MKNILKKSISLFMAVVMIATFTHFNATKTEAKESTNYVIKVNLGTNCTTIYNKEGKAIKAMICSPSSETPTGTFYVPVKYRWHEMIGNCYAQYCTRIAPQVLFHSVWYYRNGDKSSMSVSAYNVMGQKASHGCVRLLCKDAKWIYDHCAVGTKIVIFWGNKKDDPLKRPSFTRISTGAFTSWDPTDPDKNNPYMKAKPKVTAKSAKIEYNKKVKPINLVTIKDSAGNILTKKNAKIKISGKVNTKKLGKYKVKYYVKDSLGNSITKRITFKVVDTKRPKVKGAKSKKNIAMGSNVDLLQGVNAFSVPGRNLTSRIKVSVKHKGKKVKVVRGRVTFTQTGTYKVTYKVTGVNKKTATKTVTYNVTDQRVRFELNAANVTLKYGEEFDPYNYIKTVQTYNGRALDIKETVKYIGSVDSQTAGTYTITYTAQYKDKIYTARKAVLTVVVEAEEVTAPEETTTEEMTTVEDTTEDVEVPDETTAEESSTTEESSVPEETTTEGSIQPAVALV